MSPALAHAPCLSCGRPESPCQSGRRTDGPLLEEGLEHAAREAREGRPSSVLLLDIDRLHVLDQGTGWLAEERVVSSLRRILRAAGKPQDLVFHLGGGEFCMVLGGDAPSSAGATAEWIRSAAESGIPGPDGGRIDVGVSIGVVPVDGDCDASEVLARAARALREARRLGRGRIFVAEDGVRSPSPALEQNRRAASVRRAVAEDLLLLRYQPIVDLANGKATGAEALVRMSAPGGRLIEPGAFLPAAEAFGLSPALDLWVLRHALRDAAAAPSISVFVNLSGASVSDPDFQFASAEAIVGGGCDPSRIVLEITESWPVREVGRTALWMRKLREMGIRFALDDFGTGFSSMAALRDLPVDVLKIDGAFVAGLGENPSSRAFVRAAVGIADSLGIPTVAEHVERPSEGKLLRALGVTMAQGFGICAPLAGLSSVPPWLALQA
jgi:diguanylate cyclase (GGDEF)-like protein